MCVREGVWVRVVCVCVCVREGVWVRVVCVCVCERGCVG